MKNPSSSQGLHLSSNVRNTMTNDNYFFKLEVNKFDEKQKELKTDIVINLSFTRTNKSFSYKFIYYYKTTSIHCNRDVLYLFTTYNTTTCCLLNLFF